MSADLERVIKELNVFAGRVVKRLTLEVTAELVEANPFKTGWSAANWIPGIGAGPSEPAGTRENVSTSERELGVALVVSSYTIDQGRVVIQNNVPYISTINDFHRTKAGFVQESIDRGVNAVIGESP